MPRVKKECKIAGAAARGSWRKRKGFAAEGGVFIALPPKPWTGRTNSPTGTGRPKNGSIARSGSRGSMPPSGPMP